MYSSYEDIMNEYFWDINNEYCDVCLTKKLNSDNFIPGNYIHIGYKKISEFHYMIFPIIHRKSYFDLNRKEKEEADICLWQLFYLLEEKYNINKNLVHLTWMGEGEHIYLDILIFLGE
jgi:hypothetical protein